MPPGRDAAEIQVECEALSAPASEQRRTKKASSQTYSTLRCGNNPNTFVRALTWTWSVHSLFRPRRMWTTRGITEFYGIPCILGQCMLTSARFQRSQRIFSRPSPFLVLDASGLTCEARRGLGQKRRGKAKNFLGSLKTERNRLWYPCIGPGCMEFHRIP